MDPENPETVKLEEKPGPSSAPVPSGTPGTSHAPRISAMSYRASSIAAVAASRRQYSVIKVEEKHGVFHQAIPILPWPLAVVLCFFNVFAPGVGTLFSAPFCFCYPSHHKSNSTAVLINLAAALLQMLTFILIVGWIWSILWGINMVTFALKKRRHDYEKLYLPPGQEDLHQSYFEPKIPFSVRRPTTDSY